MSNNQSQHNTNPSSKNNLNTFLIVAGVIIAAVAVYLYMNKKKEEELTTAHNRGIFNEQPKLNEQPVINNNRISSNKNIDNGNLQNETSTEEIYPDENEHFFHYETGNYMVSGDENGRSYFHTYPDPSSKRKSYVIEGEIVYIQRIHKDFGYVEFINPQGVKTIGWLKMDQLTTANP